MWTCPKCRRSIAAPAGITVYCSCGARNTNPEEYLREAGRKAWALLHRYPIEHQHDCEPVEAKRWYEEEWLPLVPRFGCECHSYWRELTTLRPPNFASFDDFYWWSVDRHNDINRKLQRPIYSPLVESRQPVKGGFVRH